MHLSLIHIYLALEDDRRANAFQHHAEHPHDGVYMGQLAAGGALSLIHILHRTKFNWEDAKQRTQKGTLQHALWQGMEQLRQMRADPCFAPDAWVTTWDSHNPGVLALVRKRGEETLVGLLSLIHIL